MLIARGVEVLEFSVNLPTGQNTIYPTLIWDSHDAILVDTGYPGMLEELLAALNKIGVSSLSKIILTHHDVDHIGSLAALLKQTPQKIEVLCHEKEKEFIEGERAPIKANGMKIAKLSQQLEALPEANRMAIQRVFDNFKDLGARVDRTITDNDVLSCCGGITVIHTPGHTPGHISLYLQESKTLIAGDALFVEDTALIPAPEFINYDSGQALLSLHKLLGFDIERVVCYHGGVYSNNVTQRIGEIIRIKK